MASTTRIDTRQLLDRLIAKFGHNAAVLQGFAALFSGDRPVSVREVEEHLRGVSESQRALEALLQRPSIKQRTPEWYEARQGMITASDFAQALGAGKFGTQKQLLWKKCAPQSDDAFAALAYCPPLKWGTMYEDVAQQIYCRRNHVRIHEFGLLRHPSVANLGASPDGISELGVMLEIKCPFRREITGEVPLQYFYQIQGQLEVCGLGECDYLEVGFEEVPRETFYAGIAEEGGHVAVERGIVAEYHNSEAQKPAYAYSGLDWPAVALQAFEASSSTPLQDATFTRFHYWRASKVSTVRVTRDAAFTEKMLAELAGVWARIEAYRANPALMEAEIGLPPLPQEKRRKTDADCNALPLAYAFRDAPTTSCSTLSATATTTATPPNPPNLTPATPATATRQRSAPPLYAFRT